MKNIFLIVFLVFALFSCNNIPVENPEWFKSSDTVTNISAVTFDWNWLYKGYGKAEAEFTISDKTDAGTTTGGDVSACNIVNKTGKISDIYTYINGQPDENPKYRVWVIEYSSDFDSTEYESIVKVKWSGTLIQTKGNGKCSVETLFQVYGDWLPYSVNIRPQVEIDTMFLFSMKDISEERKEELNDTIQILRKEARDRMIARYYNPLVYMLSETLTPPSSNDDDEDIENNEDPLSDDEPGEEDENDDVIEPEHVTSLYMSAEGEYRLFVPDKKYRMQLFTQITILDGNYTNQYEITDGRLEIEFELSKKPE